MIGAERSLPYDRPPLSKSVLANPSRSSFADHQFKPRRWFDANAVRLVPGQAADTLDAARMRVQVGDETFSADDIVLATGSRPRSLPGLTPGHGIYSLRTWEDAQRLGQRLQRPGRVMIIGAGFIGLETAAVACSLGWAVTVVERDAAPLARVLPVAFAERCWDPYAAAGVRLRVGVTVDGVDRSGPTLHCQLSDGSRIAADAVIVAVGSMPNAEWLGGSGVSVDQGIVCDAMGRTSAPHVWAVGDATRWHNGWLGRAERVEQWQATRSQGDIVARALAGREPAPWAEPPYFWSDLTGGRVQFLGDCAPGFDTQLLDNDGRVIGLLSAGDRLRGIFARRIPRAIASGRELLTRDTSIDTAERWAATLLGRHQPPVTIHHSQQ
jgi:NADPH-dependent 2,4-dienoyl-CoA reductase/sulfur reductase-like enzyme